MEFIAKTKLNKLRGLISKTVLAGIDNFNDFCNSENNIFLFLQISDEYSHNNYSHFF